DYYYAIWHSSAWIF
nr:immunoglobulin light chain junction region [Macaca mulatta]